MLYGAALRRGWCEAAGRPLLLLQRAEDRTVQ